MSTSQTLPPPGRIQLDGHVDVPADRWDAVLEALKEHIALTRDEPGCIVFTVTPSEDVAHRLIVHEIFQSKEAFDAHQARAKTSRWAEISEGLPRDYTITEVP